MNSETLVFTLELHDNVYLSYLKVIQKVQCTGQLSAETWLELALIMLTSLARTVMIT